MKTSKSLLLVALASMAMAMGCSKKGDDSGTIASSRSGGRGGSNAYMSDGYYTAATGQVLRGSSMSDSQFSQGIRELVSAQIDLQYVGEIYSNSVKLKGFVQVDQRGNLITGNSSVQLIIRDSFAGTTQGGQVVPEIYVTVPATAGTAYNGVVNLTFSDEKGDIQMQGYYNSQKQFWGNLYFQNKGRSRVGPFYFVTQTCGFFKCY